MSCTERNICRFLSNWDIHGLGFHFNYLAQDCRDGNYKNDVPCGSGCGGDYTGSSGFVTSPYFPNFYPNETMCDYRIQQLEGFAVQIKVIMFDLSLEDECRNDYLEIRDGSSEDMPLVGRFCGNDTHIKTTMYSTQCNLWMR